MMFALALALAATPAATETAAPPAPLPVIQAIPVAEKPAAFLPANTEIVMSMNQEVTTKGKRWREGDTFDLSVVYDVKLAGYVVIPKGSRGVGRITWMTNKGAFGKSGKMTIDLSYVEVAGQRVLVGGSYNQEGEGNTVATVGGVVLVGVFAGFVTGESATIPQGRELVARTKLDLPVALPATQPAVQAQIETRPIAAQQPQPESAPATTKAN